MPEMYQVKNLYDKQDYAAIVALYDSQETHADWSAWDYFYLLHAYNRLKRYQACLDA